MASRKFAPISVLTGTTRERPVMNLLPELSDEDRERIIQQREDAERLRLLELHLSIAAQAVAEAQRALRFPLDSVRLDDDDAR